MPRCPWRTRSAVQRRISFVPTRPGISAGHYSGAFPCAAQVTTRRMPSDWTQPDAGWTGWRAPPDYPHVLNPPTGRIWSANNRVVGPDVSPRSATARRTVAHERSRFATICLRWPRAVPLNPTCLRSSSTSGRCSLRGGETYCSRRSTRKRSTATRRAPRCENRSRQWNPRAAADASGYLQVREFHETLARRVFEALTLPARAANPGLKLKLPRQFEEAAWELVAARPATCSIRASRTGGRSCSTSSTNPSQRQHNGLSRTSSATCRWGDANATVDPASLEPRCTRCCRGGSTCPGSRWVATMTCHTCTRPGFGASERFAVSPGHEAQAYFHMPGGQSGHPLSPLLSRRARGLGPWQAVAVPARQGRAYTHAGPRFEPLSLAGIADRYELRTVGK